MVSALSESLNQVLDIAGVRAVALIDLGSGMVVASADEDGASFRTDFSAAAASIAYAARSAIQAHGRGGNLEEIALTTASRLRLAKVLEYSRGEGLLLYLDVDLAQTNMAMASWQIGQLAPGLLGG